MAYLIRSRDGRLRICTSNLMDAAAAHQRLKRQGFRPTLTDVINRKEISPTDLRVLRQFQPVGDLAVTPIIPHG